MTVATAHDNYLHAVVRKVVKCEGKKIIGKALVYTGFVFLRR